MSVARSRAGMYTYRTVERGKNIVEVMGWHRWSVEQQRRYIPSLRIRKQINQSKKQNCTRTSSSGVEPSLSPFCATDIYIIISPTFNRERSRVWLEHAQVKNV